jgi:hypothetical protein
MALTRTKPAVALPAPERVRCVSCADTGVVDLGPADWMPCVCAAGDRWRDNPPMCSMCGERAVYCLTSNTPRCETHGQAQFFTRAK